MASDELPSSYARVKGLQRVRHDVGDLVDGLIGLFGMCNVIYSWKRFGGGERQEEKVKSLI